MTITILILKKKIPELPCCVYPWLTPSIMFKKSILKCNYLQMANKHVKRYSTSLLIEKCKLKLQWNISSHPSEWLSSKNLWTVNAGKDVERREPSCTGGGNVNWYSHYEEQYEDSLKKQGKELPYDPEIPLRGIYSEKTIIEEDTCTLMFVAALFTITRTWKQPRCP